ncbi:MAG: hypothetical protein II180_00055 [Proteobacteria bacterium]|nr:hypothetical protein [Pseudomonadota bacterium]
MRKFSLMLALLAGVMLPVTAMAAPTADSKSKSSKKKKGDKKVKEEPVVVEEPPAEEEGFTFSNEQILLNNQAVEAVSSGNYKKAEQLFNAMLQIGEFNVIWMNLGRTYANQNKCLEAKEAYEHVATSPAIKDYSVEMIQETTAGFVRELEAQCSSKVVLKCNPAEMDVTIDGGQEFKCTSEPIALVPGKHTVYAKTSYGFNTVVIESFKGETTYSNIGVIDYEQVATDAGVTPEEIRHRSKLYKILGYSFIGGGAAIAAAGFGYWGWAYFTWQTHAKDCNETDSSSNGSTGTEKKECNEKWKWSKDDKDGKDLFNTKQVIGGVIGAFGVAMLITGVTLVIVDAKKYQPQVELLDAQEQNRARLEFVPVFSPEFSGLTLSGRF